MKFLYIHILLLFKTGFSLTIYPYKCPTPNSVADFNLTKFQGVWYEIQRTFTLFETGLKCSATVITNAENGKALYRRTGINIINRHFVLMQGKLHTFNANFPGSMELRLGRLRFRSTYIVIDTNYEDYAVVWSCYESPLLNGSLGHAENLWILSRRMFLNSEYLSKINKLLDAAKINRAALIETNFDNCTDVKGRFNNKLSSEF